MKIWILNYLEAREFDPEELTLAVRIFDPGATKLEHNKPVPLKCSTLWLDEVRLEFEDIDIWSYQQEGGVALARRLQEERKCFDERMAEFMLAETARTIKKAQALMIHCNAGLSRSPAVARALVERFEIQPEWSGKRRRMMEDDYHGNEWVYRLLKKAELPC